MRLIETIHDIAAPPHKVWEVLLDFPSYAQWNPFFGKIEGEASPGSTLKVSTRGKNGGTGMSFTPTVLQVQAPERLAWRGHFLFPAAFEGTHEFLLEATSEQGTRLRHLERFRGLLIPFLGGLLKDTEANFHAMNKALEQEVLARAAQT